MSPQTLFFQCEIYDSRKFYCSNRQDFNLQIGHNLSITFRMRSSSEDGDEPPHLFHQAIPDSHQGVRKHVNRP